MPAHTAVYKDLVKVQ